MIKISSLCIFLFISINCFSQTIILDSQTKQPVSYATISFGNGQGVFADDEGKFLFTKKIYPDIDSLFVSALGFKEIRIATENLLDTLLLEPHIDQLDEVVIRAKIDRKFKVESLKPYLDDDYYKCWLPTIESEIAVYFNNPDDKLKKLSNIHFPIALESKDWDKRNKSNAEKKPFSTLFKVNIYNNDNGIPGKPLTFQNIVFRVTEKDGDAFNLDVSAYDVYIPKTGLFVSIQVLGYTDKTGKLLPNKKYKEIKSRDGVVKIPTNFRPLLPFTDLIPENNTFIKRVFVNKNQWIQFKEENINDSSLLSAGLNNYGMGISFKVYKDE
ncbi:peptidase associated/transthyretin-like domain-containing protein [Formosa maritima]|uniref:Carboxypeptidase-like regulatory domain-containing protein n=1 Tax=Formosa maritima TaxID=2592046 RepID=A0A5D0GAE5_9FLAO|nr:carboxypeptidase-like regulatory domain-containing protein [Formosa maritima]TYA54792.1 carboxypeptidase-like regulatory domain-containing protein [Formosa maritima]